MRNLGYADRHLIRDIAAGLPVVGSTPAIGAFPPKARPAQHTFEELMGQARKQQKASLRTMRSPGDWKLDEVMWGETMAKV